MAGHMYRALMIVTKRTVTATLTQQVTIQHRHFLQLESNQEVASHTFTEALDTVLSVQCNREQLQ